MTKSEYLRWLHALVESRRADFRRHRATFEASEAQFLARKPARSRAGWRRLSTRPRRSRKSSCGSGCWRSSRRRRAAAPS